ncbi:MAG TPA: ABC transporter ATP-binding protein [Candidatus Binatia bacterium]|jgi:ATP-binding cassette subfamily B protein|nr:ABC transporter ATP-binding protein [Candidatus Binatia bacterium]
MPDIFGEEELGKAYDARLIGRLWTYVRPYRPIFWAAVLLSPVNRFFSALEPYLLKRGIDDYIVPRNLSGLATLSLVYVGVIVAEFLSQYGQQYLTTMVAQRSLADLRVALFAKLQRFPMRFFDQNPVGRVVSRLTTDVDVLQEMFAAGAMTIVLDVLGLVGIVAFMLWINFWLALTSLALLPFMMLAVDFFRRMARKTYRQIRERIGRLNGYLQEAISGMRAIQLAAREAGAFAEFDRLNSAHRDANHLSNKLEAALFSIVEAVSTVSIALMLLEGGRLHAAHLVQLGTVVAFIQYLQQFFIPIRDFSAKYAVLQSSMTAAERIFALIDLAPESAPAAPRVPARVQGEIVFDHVWFAYRDADWVLRDVSFRVAPGEQVALVGATGAGKTTVIKLLDRLYDVQRGRILVDGIDVRDWDRTALRRRIAVVLQDVFLFSGTVAENVTLGRPDISRAAVEAAAAHVNADGFIRRMGGYDATVRERGSNLSGGQRQLLAFARALAHDPAILVLDEATSNVDPETEWLVQDALAKLLETRTALVIAHRLSTIEHADRILVFHHGELREAGAHADLLARDGLYARLYRMQYASEAAPAARAAGRP